MRYVRPLSAIFLSAMLAGAAWGQEADRSDSAPKDGEKEKAAETEKDQRPDRPAFEEMRKKMLEKFDADKDGKLNDEERAKAREFRHEHPGEFMRERDGEHPPRGPRPPRGPEGRGRGRDGRGPDRGGPGGPRPDGSPPAMRLFDRFDEDGDGQLSRGEFERLVIRMREFGPPRPAAGGPGRPDGPRSERRRPGSPDGPGADRRPPHPREDGQRGSERRRPRPPRDDDEHHERADRPRHPDGDDHGKATESEEKDEKPAEKSTT